MLAFLLLLAGSAIGFALSCRDGGRGWNKAVTGIVSIVLFFVALMGLLTCWLVAEATRDVLGP